MSPYTGGDPVSLAAAVLWQDTMAPGLSDDRSMELWTSAMDAGQEDTLR